MGKHHQSHPIKTPEQVKHAENLPESAEFVGYGVHLPRTDEFLAFVEPRGPYSLRAWTMYPNYGLAFQRFNDARREAEDYARGAIVVYMYDFRDRYFVIPTGS